MTAREAKTYFGEVLDITRREPVLVTKNNRPVGIMVSIEDAANLLILEDPVTRFGSRPRLGARSGHSREAERDLEDVLLFYLERAATGLLNLCIRGSAGWVARDISGARPTLPPNSLSATFHTSPSFMREMTL